MDDEALKKIARQLTDNAVLLGDWRMVSLGLALEQLIKKRALPPPPASDDGS